MASQPQNLQFSPHEIAVGNYIAAGLWILSAALLTLLAAWCLSPPGLG